MVTRTSCVVWFNRQSWCVNRQSGFHGWSPFGIEWLTKELSSILESDLLTQSLQERVLLTEMAGATASARQRQILHWKQTLHSERVDDSDAEVQALVNLWNNVNAERDEVAAWSTVLAVLLHDPRAVLR